jgi:hypothetical protein
VPSAAFGDPPPSYGSWGWSSEASALELKDDMQLGRVGIVDGAVVYAIIHPLAIYSTTFAFAAVRSDGSVVTWGRASSGGNCDAVRAQLAAGVQQIYSTESAFAAVKSDGSVVMWGHADRGGNCGAARD